MPYLICPTCRLTVYSAARYATPDRCPGCDGVLERAKRSAGLRDWTLSVSSPLAERGEATHGTC